MLVLMVRGLFSKLRFPYAQFPCAALCGDQFYDIFWQAVCQLERCGFRVLACTCDGLSSNRRFMKLHHSGSSLKVLNPYASDGRYVFFLSDPPHLLKTTRNCWASTKRLLWVGVLCAIISLLKCFYSNSMMVSIYHGHIFETCIWKPTQMWLLQVWPSFRNNYVNLTNNKHLGLTLLPKLKYEHVELTNVSKMRVDLAAQV